MMEKEELVKHEKLYYSIGEVAEMFNTNVSQIRFWENNFETLRPKRNAKGNRLFTPRDIDQLRLIHHLLKEKGYTIEGARYKLLHNKKEEVVRVGVIHSLTKIRGFLTELKGFLSREESDEPDSSDKKNEKVIDPFDPNQGQLF
jgi:DNA-binding transcriptional MerR regulator